MNQLKAQCPKLYVLNARIRKSQSKTFFLKNIKWYSIAKGEVEWSYLFLSFYILVEQLSTISLQTIHNIIDFLLEKSINQSLSNLVLLLRRFV